MWYRLLPGYTVYLHTSMARSGGQGPGQGLPVCPNTRGDDEVVMCLFSVGGWGP